MRSLRFWQKVYLLTLAFFLVALFGGFAFIAWQNQQRTLSAEVEGIQREQRFVTQRITADLEKLDDPDSRSFSTLIYTYISYYEQEGLAIYFTKAPDVLHSSFSFPPVWLEDMPSEPGVQVWERKTLGGEEYLIAMSTLPKGHEEYALVCARSMEPLLASWDQMNRTLLLGSLSISIIVAIGLFFILRRLSKPLGQLAATADEFSEGSFHVRAEQKSTDEIGMLAASFNAMADTAESQIEEIRSIAEKNARMAASLSHEIRTPLTAIKGFAEYMQLADLDEQERASALTYIIEEGTRLQKLSQRMLQLFSLEQEDIALRKVDLVEIVRRSELSLQPRAARSQIDLSVRAGFSEDILGDDVLVESLVTNLLDNAIASCCSGDSVSLVVEGTDEAVRLSITDTGCGLKQEDIERLGEPFFRSDKARSRQEGGAGLGVALCYEIVELHGAQLTYESQYQEGTTATVEFTRP